MKRFRWSLRTMLVLVAFLCAAFAYQSHVDRQITRAVAGLNQLMKKGVANFPAPGLKGASFTVENASATDADLDAFAIAFNGYLPSGAPEFVALNLNGSRVSPEAIERFRRAAPGCKVIP